MIWSRFSYVNKVLLYKHPVNMNKSMDGLAAVAYAEMQENPCSDTLFVFVNRSRDKIKMLLWETNGFWIFYKRLERERFHWPDWFDQPSLALSLKQLNQLTLGYNLNGMRPHSRVNLSFSL